jgi:hypothetical protein
MQSSWVPSHAQATYSCSWLHTILRNQHFSSPQALQSKDHHLFLDHSNGPLPHHFVCSSALKNVSEHVITLLKTLLLVPLLCRGKPCSSLAFKAVHSGTCDSSLSPGFSPCSALPVPQPHQPQAFALTVCTAWSSPLIIPMVHGIAQGSPEKQNQPDLCPVIPRYPWGTGSRTPFRYWSTWVPKYYTGNVLVFAYDLYTSSIHLIRLTI